MERYKNVQQILKLAIWIQSRIQGVSLQEIADELEVSRRTAERMRNCLKELFYPMFDEVQSTDKVKRWKFKTFIPALMNFNADDIAELKFAQKSFAKSGKEQKAKAIGDIILKIKAFNKENLIKIENDLESILEAEGFAIRQHPRTKIDSSIIETIRESLKAQKILKFDYPVKGEIKEGIEVAPYGVLYGDKNYLVGFNDYVNDYRLYELSNINNLTIKATYFDKDEDFALTEYAQNSFGIYQEEPFNVILKVSKTAKKEALNYHFHPSQTIEVNPDDSLNVKFKAGGSSAICWELFKWGEQVEIIEPASLKDLYKEHLEKAIKTLK